MAFDVPEKPESAATQAASSPITLCQLLMASQFTANRRAGREPCSCLSQKRMYQKVPKGHKELDPAFTLASTSVCDIGQFT